MEPKRGLFAGGGTTVRLPRQIPWPLAMEFLLCADLISAERAYEMGLLNAVVPRDRPSARRRCAMRASSQQERLALPDSLRTQMFAFRRRVWAIKLTEAGCGAAFALGRQRPRGDLLPDGRDVPRRPGGRRRRLRTAP